jgi:hypothetical protein
LVATGNERICRHTQLGVQTLTSPCQVGLAWVMHAWRSARMPSAPPRQPCRSSLLLFQGAEGITCGQMTSFLGSADELVGR